MTKSCRIVSWDRQDRLNAWDLRTLTAIADQTEAAGADPAARSIVVRGAGEHFSAGDDLKAARESTREAWAETIEGFQRLTRVVLDSPLPVLAAIDGVCVGGALEFAASCDARICTDRARFLTPEVRIGFVLSNAGTLFLPAVLGEAAARDLLLTGTERSSAWALQRGFVLDVVPPDELEERAAAWAAHFDATSREAVARTKRLLNARFGDLLARAMDAETEACVDLFHYADAAAALEAFSSR